MNNIFIILAAIVVLFIAFVQCFNDEDMILFIIGSSIAMLGIIIGVVGIVLDKNFFEMY